MPGRASILARRGTAGISWLGHGQVGPGQAGLGKVRRGVARRGTEIMAQACQGLVRQGWARSGQVWLGAVRQGLTNGERNQEMSTDKTIECSTPTARLLSSVVEKRQELREDIGQLGAARRGLEQRRGTSKCRTEVESLGNAKATKVSCAVDGSACPTSRRSNIADFESMSGRAGVSKPRSPLRHVEIRLQIDTPRRHRADRNRTCVSSTSPRGSHRPGVQGVSGSLAPAPRS